MSALIISDCDDLGVPTPWVQLPITQNSTTAYPPVVERRCGTPPQAESLSAAAPNFPAGACVPAATDPGGLTGCEHSAAATGDFYSGGNA